MTYLKNDLSSLEQRIMSDLCSGNFKLTVHAVERCNSRQIARKDIQTAAQDWLDCWTDDDEVVHVIGPDWRGDEIEIRAAYDGETVVITVIGTP